VAIGQRFAGKYLVTNFIGVGGMSIVVAARHEQLGQTVAVKFLAAPTTSTRTAAYRFFREARAAASLRSEHIVRVTDAGTDESGRPFMAMEYLEGADLAATLKATGPLAPEMAVGYVLQACEGIAEANAAGIIHRDLKPANIFVTRRVDGSPLVKVLDFGISKVLNVELKPPAEQSVSQRNSLVGTPLYMSPEQLRDPSNVDGRTDVWALGLILFELLTGKNPFWAPNMPEIFAAILTGDGVPALASLRPDLPPPLVHAVCQCLERDLAKRTPHVGLLANALLPWAPLWARDAGERAARLLGATAAPASASDTPASSFELRTTRPRRRARWAAASLALVSATAALTLMWIARRPGASGPSVGAGLGASVAAQVGATDPTASPASSRGPTSVVAPRVAVVADAQSGTTALVGAGGARAVPERIPQDEAEKGPPAPAALTPRLAAAHTPRPPRLNRTKPGPREKPSKVKERSTEAPVEVVDPLASRR
jgi:serine/threonine-protein kinase